MTKILLCALLSLLISTTSPYLIHLAYDLAHLASITYETQAVIDGWKCDECQRYEVIGQKSFFSTAANIQGYAGYFPKHGAIIVGFRGSVDTKNWLYNLNTLTSSFPGCSGCRVHKGFYSAYKGVGPLVRSTVESLLAQFRDAKIIVTGHSLGGVMGVFCALDLKQTYGKVQYLYTFGQPRAGNQKFADFVQKQIPEYFRLINYADMVPHVPQSFLGFKHAGREIWYNPRGMDVYKSCVSQDKSCSKSVSLTSMSTDDHSLTQYMQLKAIDLNLRTERTLSKEEVMSDQYSEEDIEAAEYIQTERINESIGAKLGY